MKPNDGRKNHTPYSAELRPIIVTTTCGAPPRKRRTARSRGRRTAHSQRSAGCRQRLRSGRSWPLAPGTVENARFRQGECGPEQHRAAEQRDENEDRRQPNSGVEDAADQRRQHRHSTSTDGDQADHRSGAFAVVEIADDGAADATGRSRRRAIGRSARQQGGDGDAEDRRRAGHVRAASRRAAPAGGRTGRTAARAPVARPPAPEVERDRQLDASPASVANLADQPGNRRHDDVERHRPDRGQRDQQASRPRRGVRRAASWLSSWRQCGGTMRGFRSARADGSRQRARRGCRDRPAARACRRTCA